MPKYVIEREIPGLGLLSQEEVADIARRSCSVLQDMGPRIVWLHSYATEDKMYCVYIAPDEAMIVEHARRGGFPVDNIARVGQIVDLTTAEGAVPAASANAPVDP